MIQTLRGGSLGFFVFVHLVFDGVADKAVQALSLTGGKILDDLALALLDDDIDAVIGFLVISGGCFFLCVGIFQSITPWAYTNVSICKNV